MFKLYSWNYSFTQCMQNASNDGVCSISLCQYELHTVRVRSIYQAPMFRLNKQKFCEMLTFFRTDEDVGRHSLFYYLKIYVPGTSNWGKHENEKSFMKSAEIKQHWNRIDTFFQPSRIECENGWIKTNS